MSSRVGNSIESISFIYFNGDAVVDGIFIIVDVDAVVLIGFCRMF